jgi:rubrerythrin
MHCLGTQPVQIPSDRARSGLSRQGFLAVTARNGVAVAIGTTLAGVFATSASAASGPLADLDLTLARLTVGVELLAADFYSAALESKKLQGDELRYFQRARFNEDEHLTAVSEILSGAGQTVSTADDFDFTFPKGTFESRQSIARLGVTIETISLGTYLGAVDAFTPSDLKTTAARIATSEAEHLSLLSRMAYGRPVGISFPPALDYATASAELDQYLS